MFPQRWWLSVPRVLSELVPLAFFKSDKVDLLSKLPKTEFNQKMAAAKWSEILEGLNIAIDLIGSVPKLTAGDYGDLIQKLKRLGDHSHVQVRLDVAFTSHHRSLTS